MSDLPALHGCFEIRGDVIEALGHDRIEDRIRARDVGAGADGAELELVPGERERTRPVPVSRFLGKLGKNRHAGLKHTALFASLGGAFFDLLDDVVELVAQEDRDDRRRGLVGAQAVIVVRRPDRHAKHIGILIDRANNRRHEHQELRVLMRRVARIEQVFAHVGRHRPVIVLAAAVDPGKRLLVQQADQAVLVGDLPHLLHDQILVIRRQIAVLEEGGQFILARGHLVVARLDGHAQLEQFRLRIRHERQNALGDIGEILVFQFLPLRRLGAEKRPSTVDQVRTKQIKALVDQEVFLLRSDGREDVRCFLVPEQSQDAQRLLAQCFHRAEQGGLLVERLARPTQKRGGYYQRRAVRMLDDVSRARRVPGGVAARFKSRAVRRRESCWRPARP